MSDAGDSVASTYQDTIKDVNDVDEAVISISSDDDVTIADVDTLTHWSNCSERFRVIKRQVATDNRIEWNLPPLTIANNSEATIAHCRQIIDNVLSHGYISCFKVGISYLPYDRFVSAPFSYTRSGYDRMILICIHDDASFVAEMEKSLLRVYRRSGRHGCVNSSGHPLCANVNPGGENAYCGWAPHFVYVVFKSSKRSVRVR